MDGLEAAYTENQFLFWLMAAALAAVAVLWAVLLQLRFSQLLGQYRALTGGVGHGALDEVLQDNLVLAQQTAKRVEELEDGCALLHRAHQQAIQHVGTVRFNPFKGEGTGGDQSFAAAILDANGNGLVISSLFNRSETRTFAKPVQGGRSRYALSDEEQEAIRIAMSGPAANDTNHERVEPAGHGWPDRARQFFGAGHPQ